MIAPDSPALVTRNKWPSSIVTSRTKGAEEGLLGAERHDDRVDAVDPDRAVDQRPGAVVVSDRDGQGELGHHHPPGALSGSRARTT